MYVSGRKLEPVASLLIACTLERNGNMYINDTFGVNDLSLDLSQEDEFDDSIYKNCIQCVFS